MGEWKVSEFGTAFDVNPRRDIKRGQITPFIPMDALSTNRRDVARIDEREFTGSGMKFKNGDTLLARITPCLENGKTAYISSLSDDAIAHGSTEYIVIAGKHGISDGLFGYYLARSPEFRTYAIGQMEGTSGRQRVPSDAICKYLIPIPPLPEQRAIAHILGTLDDKIELNRRTNETLEAMARDIFKDWFVDFGPTRAKMEGREPYLAVELWSLFPERLDDEGKPEGWKFGKIGDVAELNPESWSARNAPPKIEYVDLANTKWGAIEKTEFYQWNEAPSRARRILRVGDTIIGTVRPGNGSYAFIGTNNLTGSTGFAVLRSKQSNLRELVYCAVTSSENIERLAHLADGGAYPAIRPEVAADTTLLRGSKLLDEAFSILCGSMIDCIEANKQESQTLAQTCDLLLPKLLSGEIRVKDAEKMVDGAL
jgi:type I restriction enzyme S subunit